MFIAPPVVVKKFFLSLSFSLAAIIEKVHFYTHRTIYIGAYKPVARVERVKFTSASRPSAGEVETRADSLACA